MLCVLFRPRFNNVKVHLEEYLSQMEEKIISNQSNMDHFYFMVVHCLEVSACWDALRIPTNAVTWSHHPS